MKLTKEELSNRFFGLDLLRCIAILAVLYQHSTYSLKDTIFPRLTKLFVIYRVSIFYVFKRISLLVLPGIKGKIHFPDVYSKYVP